MIGRRNSGKPGNAEQSVDDQSPAIIYPGAKTSRSEGAVLESVAPAQGPTVEAEVVENESLAEKLRQAVFTEGIRGYNVREVDQLLRDAVAMAQELEEAVARLRSETEHQGHNIERLSSMGPKAQEELERLREENDRHTRELAAATQELSAADGRLTALLAERDGLQAQLLTASINADQLDSLKQENQSLRLQLVAANSLADGLVEIQHQRDKWQAEAINSVSDLEAANQRIRELENKLAQFDGIASPEVISQVLLTAQKVADDVVREAKRQAALIIERAEDNAQRVEDERVRELSELDNATIQARVVLAENIAAIRAAGETLIAWSDELSKESIVDDQAVTNPSTEQPSQELSDLSERVIRYDYDRTFENAQGSAGVVDESRSNPDFKALDDMLASLDERGSDQEVQSAPVSHYSFGAQLTDEQATASETPVAAPSYSEALNPWLSPRSDGSELDVASENTMTEAKRDQPEARSEATDQDEGEATVSTEPNVTFDDVSESPAQRGEGGNVPFMPESPVASVPSDGSDYLPDLDFQPPTDN